MAKLEREENCNWNATLLPPSAIHAGKPGIFGTDEGRDCKQDCAEDVLEKYPGIWPSDTVLQKDHTCICQKCGDRISAKERCIQSVEKTMQEVQIY
jgi:hypothetical protein